MVIGADLAAALPEMRAEAESLMVDRCTIERFTSYFDEGEQKTVTDWLLVLADEPCMFVDEAGSARSLLTDETVTPTVPVVKVSVRVLAAQPEKRPQPDDRITLASGPVVYVTHVPQRSNQVQCRIQCRRQQ